MTKQVLKNVVLQVEEQIYIDFKVLCFKEKTSLRQKISDLITNYVKLSEGFSLSKIEKEVSEK